MSNATLPQTNITVGLGLVELGILSTVTTTLCCMLLLVNIFMLHALRSKVVFRETPRYILLYNLLFADTMQMSMSQLLYLLSVCRIMLTYPVCGLLVTFASVTKDISPLTLVLMALERYVAVCFPLRHATFITIRNTALGIMVVWACCFLNACVRVILLLDFPFEDLESLWMKSFCSSLVMFLGQFSDEFDNACTCILFLSAGAAVIFSYVGVVVAARSASTDKASALKARNTLLLHLLQLGLSLLSAMHSSLILAIAKVVTRIVLVHLLNVFYLFVIILPRCLSAFVYGLRDQTIRPVFVYYLCCRLTLSSQKRLKSHRIHGVN